MADFAELTEGRVGSGGNNFEYVDGVNELLVLFVESDNDVE